MKCKECKYYTQCLSFVVELKKQNGHCPYENIGGKMEYKILTPIQEREKEIKNIIDEYLSICQGEQEEKENGSKARERKAQTLPHRLRIRLAEYYRQERTMPMSETLGISADKLHSLYLSYMAIISYINMSVPYNPNKVEFLAFARISVDAFTMLLDNGNEEVKQECSDIDSDLLNLTLSASEQGQIKEKSGQMRLKAKGGIGHALTEVGDAESVIDKLNDGLDERQARYELKSVLDKRNLIDKQIKK